MAGTSAGAIRAEQRQCQSLMRMRKGVSQQQEHVNGVTANQGSDKVKYILSPCWRSILLATTWHVWFTDEHVITLLLAENTI